MDAKDSTDTKDYMKDSTKHQYPLQIVETVIARDLQACASLADASVADRARSLLARHGARFVDEAIRDNPDGMVSMVTTRYATEIFYQVAIGDPDAGDRGRARIVWDRAVTFGATDRTVAGGHEFVAAARAQDEVSSAAFALMDHARSIEEER